MRNFAWLSVVLGLAGGCGGVETAAAPDAGLPDLAPVQFAFPDIDEEYAVTLQNSHLSYVQGRQHADADAGFTMQRKTLDLIMLQQTTLAAAAEAGEVQVEGNPQKFAELMGLMDTFEFWFNIVTP